MNVLVATDGSKYGQWGLNWVAKLPFVEPPRVTALYVLDIAALRAPFLAQPVMAGNERYIQEEIQRMEARSVKVLKEAKQQLASLKLTGTACKEQGAVAPVILKRAPKRDGLLVVGSQGLDALDRFMLGSVSTNLIHHATCPVLVIKGQAVPLRRIILATDGSDASAKALAFVLSKFQPSRSTGNGGLVPIHVSVIHVMPFVKYPPNPPGVGDPATLAERQWKYVALIFLSLVVLAGAARLSGRLRQRGWLDEQRLIAVALAVVVPLGVVCAVLPPFSDAVDVPANLLWRFRIASLGGNLLLWSVLTVGFGAAAARRERELAAPAPEATAGGAFRPAPS